AAEERREEVERHGRAEDRLAPDEAHALEDARERGARSVRGPAVADERDRAEQDDERRRVDRVEPRRAALREEEAAQERAEDGRELERRRVERDGLRERAGRDEAREERLSRGQVERDE